MTQGKRNKSKTEVLKKQDKDILDLEKTIQKDIQVDDLSLGEMVGKSVDSACEDLFTSGKKAKKREKKEKSFNQIERNPIPKPDSPSGNAFVLTLSNHLKIAENKLKELEDENERLRLDNEKLMVAGEALKEAVEKFSSENKALKSTYKEDRMAWSDQKNDLENLAEDQSTEIKGLKMKINALEKHLSQDIRKTRVRERELENRLELKQNEMESIIRDKDQTLLKFKQELDFLREKAEQDRQNHHLWMEKKVQDKERTGRAIQALQLSLQLLENSNQQEEEFGLEEKSEFFEKTSNLDGSSAPQEASLNQAESSVPVSAESEENIESLQEHQQDQDEENKIEEEAG
ncbi:MAG: hypothetical protein OXK80_01085 [Bdellovibrionales bacterium]|nr:hypothetical protein [Bdellovibrionales bacterium]